MEAPGVIGLPCYNPRDFGARGDGTTKDTAAIQKAMDACAAAGGGTVYLGPGRYLTAPFYLASNVTLYLEAGTIILGSQDRADYAVVERRYAGTTQLTLEALVNGVDLECVTLAGRGTIDGRGQPWWQAIRDHFKLPKDQRPALEEWKTTEERVRKSIWHRPRLFELVRCRNVLMQGVTLQNSGFWNLHLLYCRNAKLHALTLLNPPDGCNADGMDLDSCRDVCVSDCFLSVGDDCICLKSGWDEDGRRIGIPTENVTVTNCITHAGHGGVVIGSDMSGGVRNVVVSNCVFRGTDIGIRLKTMRGRGGAVENFNVSNIVMDGVAHPIHMDMHYWKPTAPEPVSERTPRFRGFRFSQIDAVHAEAAGYIHGLEEMPIEGLRLDGVRIAAKKPFYCRHARDVELRHLRLECEEGPELQLEDVAGVEIDHLRLRETRAPGPAIRLTRTRGAVIQDAGTAGANGRRLELVDTDAAEVGQA